MLKKIDFIRNAGIYRSFIWGTLPELKRFNLFYGWNYSGKTTLSKIIQALERGAVPVEFTGCEFQVSHTDGASFGTSGVLLHPKIRVFNRAFIENNFHQDMAGAKPMVVIGEENLRLKNRLKTVLARREKVIQKQTALTNEAGRVDEELKLKARDSARIVGELFGDRTYDRRNLLATTDGLPSDYSSLILPDADRDSLLEEWKRAGDYQTLNPLAYDGGDLLKSVAKIPKVLRKTASYQAIERLKKNRAVENWVREGLSLHNEWQQCEFCGSTITADRWAELQGHFSAAYQELHASVESLLEQVAGKGCSFAFHDVTKIFPELKPQYITAKDEAASEAMQINGQIFTFAEALRRKLQNLETVENLKVNFLHAKQLRAAIRRCNEIVSAHNQKVASADQVRNAARAKIINHFAAEYVTTSDYRETKARIAELRADARRAGEIVTSIGVVISRVETEIKNASIAPRKINDRLKVLMADDNIEAVKVSETDFEFRRNSQRAINMSEGERTAVAFAYFLAKLEEGGENLAELIVVIDDPICSFDSNHIFSVYSIIERNLSAAKQLIVLTHNADFFGLVKDWMKSREKSFYMVNRLLNSEQEWYSTVTPLPRLLEKFKSDYLYTYHCLKAIDDNPSPSLESMCGVPNTVRRMLETYLGFRYPEAGAWHEKLERVISSETTCTEIRKFTDEFSHSHYLHRAMEVPDYVSHCKRMVAEVLGAPQPGQSICDPACGTGGFLLAAHDFLAKHHALDRAQKKRLKAGTLFGIELVDNVTRLCAMNLLLHGIGGESEDDLPVVTKDALAGKHGEYEIVLANPPFGKKSSVTIVNEAGESSKESLIINRDDFWASTSNKQLNFLQHIFTILKQHGRAAVVLPDNVLFEGGAGEIIRRELLKQADVHTLLRLPTGIFYAQGVKANILFFDRKPAQEKPWTQKLWIYDLRTSLHFTLKENTLKRTDLDDFVKCYNTKNRHERKESERFKSFTYEELTKRDKVNLDIFWLKDDALEESANLPAPEIIAQEITDDLEAASEQFSTITEDLKK